MDQLVQASEADPGMGFMVRLMAPTTVIESPQASSLLKSGWVSSLEDTPARHSAPVVESGETSTGCAPTDIEARSIREILQEGEGNRKRFYPPRLGVSKKKLLAWFYEQEENEADPQWADFDRLLTRSRLGLAARGGRGFGEAGDHVNQVVLGQDFMLLFSSAMPTASPLNGRVF